MIKLVQLCLCTLNYLQRFKNPKLHCFLLDQENFYHLCIIKFVYYINLINFVFIYFQNFLVQCCSSSKNHFTHTKSYITETGRGHNVQTWSFRVLYEGPPWSIGEMNDKMDLQYSLSFLYLLNVCLLYSTVYTISYWNIFKVYTNIISIRSMT